MKRFAVGLLIAMLGVAALVGVSLAAGGGSTPAQTGDPSSQQGWLGVRVANIDERLRNHFHLTVESGVVVVWVSPGGPAGASGLKAGDVVQAINGKPVENVDQAISVIRSFSPGTALSLTVLRGQETLTVQPTLGAPPHLPSVRDKARTPSPLPSYLDGLLSPGLLKGLLHADVEVLGPDNAVVSVGLTAGKIQSITQDGVLSIVRKDGKAVQLSTTKDTQVLVGGHPINLAGLKQETPVLVVEKDGAVAFVVGWPGDIALHFKPRKEHSKHRQPSHRAAVPPTALERDATTDLSLDRFRGSMRGPALNPELRRQLQERIRAAQQQWHDLYLAPAEPPQVPGEGMTF